MVDRINDIAWQAHQGSVAAIIQLLNERLAKSGVRTRAVFVDGVLQLLCEAARVEQLEQSTLVAEIQEVLESTAPRNIRRVKINSRIVREQQLLWLKEISSDRENQLLWSQEITLSQPNILQQLIHDFTQYKTEFKKLSFNKTKHSPFTIALNKTYKRKKVSKIGIRVASLCSLLLLGWVVYALLGDKVKTFMPLETAQSLNTANANESQKEARPPATYQNISTEFKDPFAAAVRIANEATASGKTATNSTQWLDLAARWQRASDVMGSVPPDHSRYHEAKIRTQLYKKYSEAAQQQAAKSEL